MFSLGQIDTFVSRYRPEGLIIDTNILIVFLIGNYDRSFMDGCGIVNNTDRKYTSSDIGLLKTIFRRFNKLVLMPQVIAELSNIAITKPNFGDRHLPYLESVISFLKKTDEGHQEYSCLWGMELKTLKDFGFTDMTMFEFAKKTGMPILTDEHMLYGYSLAKGVPVIKFQHIKNQQYQSVFVQ